MMKKKQPRPKKARQAPRPVKRAQKPVPPTEPATPAAPITSSVSATTASALVVTPRPLARMHRKSPAQKSGSELVRYLRIHSKRPYGRRGQKAILGLAARVTQDAQQESKSLADVLGHNLTFVEESLARLQPATVTTTVE